MQKRTKEQLLEIVISINKANDYIKNLLSDNGMDKIIDILTEEQRAAILIGENIEKFESNHSTIVKDLEEYCELIWQCSQTNITSEQLRFCDQLSESMKQIYNRINNEIKERYTIVFLPYKASMWDCFESIWRAASEDTECTCIVMPIPYFDKNTDGSFAEMHYEGNEFPDYVHITNYNEFNLQENYPDVIYIHNPYDNCNHVTSVHPAFYSKELRTYTSNLIYVPYYVTDGELPKAHSDLIVNYTADKLILQSENMKKSLIQAGIDENKLVVLGSPKIDKMLLMDNQELNIPFEWKQFIGGKKVFLYNTSISSVLDDGQKILDKLKDVFNAFNRHREVALIWRPHPLLRSTLLSMRKTLVDEYDKLEKWFVDNKIGILDKTADVNKSVALSDSYVGEMTSSIVHLAGVIGRPLYILNNDVMPHLSFDEYASIEFMDCDAEGGYLWFVANTYHCLCEMDINNGKIEVLGTIPDTMWTHELQYVNIQKCNDKIVMIPYAGNGICEYDLITKQFRKNYFKNEYIKLNFGRCVRYKDYLFFTPLEYSSILRYDVNTGEFTYLKNCIDEMKKRMNKKLCGPLFIWGVSSFDNQLFLAAACSNHVLILNMDNGKYEIISIGKDTNTYRGMVSDSKYSWLIQSNNPTIVRWNRETGEVREFNAFPKDFICGNIPFKNIIDCNENLYLFPFHASHIIQMDKKTGNMKYPDFNMPFVEGTFKSDYYNIDEIRYHFAKKVSNTEIVAFTKYDNSIVLVNVENNICEKFKCQFDHEHLIYNFSERIQLSNQVFSCYIYESEEMPIDIYIDYINAGLHEKQKQMNAYGKIAVNSDGTCGKKVHNYVKSLLQ